MDDEGWPFYRWHSYPRQPAFLGEASMMLRQCENFCDEMAKNNPSLHLSTAQRYGFMLQQTIDLSEALKRWNAEAYEQRWLYKQLIDEGRCP